MQARVGSAASIVDVREGITGTTWVTRGEPHPLRHPFVALGTEEFHNILGVDEELGAFRERIEMYLSKR